MNALPSIGLLLLLSLISLFRISTQISEHQPQNDMIFRNVDLDGGETIDLTNLNFSAVSGINDRSKNAKTNVKFTYMIGNLEYDPNATENTKDEAFNAKVYQNLNADIMRKFIKLTRTKNFTMFEPRMILANETLQTEVEVRNASAPVENDQRMLPIEAENNTMTILPTYINYEGKIDNMLAANILDCTAKMNEEIESNESRCNRLASNLLIQEFVEDPNVPYEACIKVFGNKSEEETE